MPFSIGRPVRHLTASVLLTAGILFGATNTFGESSESTADILILTSPAGSNSAEPHLSKGSDGTIVLSWQERETEGNWVSLRYSTLTDGKWQAANTIAKGNDLFVNWADFPSVSPIAADLWAAHWLVKRPGGSYAYDIAISLSQDAGLTWIEAMTPHTDNTRTEHGFVSLFPWQEGVGALWLDGRNMTGDGHGSEAGSASGGMSLRAAVIAADLSIKHEYLLDELVCDCCQTDIAPGPHGPIAVFRNRSKEEIRDIYVSRFIDDQWLEGQAVANDGWEIAGCPVNGPAIDVSGKEVGVTWFTMANDDPAVSFARSSDAAATFSDPVSIDGTRASGRVDVVLLDNGDAVVSWLRSGEDEQGELAIRIVSRTGRLSAIHAIAPSSIARPAGFPQMVGMGNQLLFAWTDTSGDTPRVQTALLDIAFLQE